MGIGLKLQIVTTSIYYIYTAVSFDMCIYCYKSIIIYTVDDVIGKLTKIC